MFIGDFILALFLGLVFAAIFGGTMRPRAGMPGILPVFIVFSLFAWVGGLWLKPFGPPIYGVSWMPGLTLSVLIFLLLAATSRQPPKTGQDVEGNIIAKDAASAVGVAFWFLIIALVAAIIVGYLT